MFIEIGRALIDSDRIAAVSPDLHAVGIVRVLLTNGKTVCIKAYMSDVEDALTDAGLITSDDMDIPASDIKVLMDLRDLGYNYIAKDKTGAVYAFIDTPVRCGAYWQPAEESSERAYRVYSDSFDWLPSEPAIDSVADINNLLSTKETE